MPAQHAVLRQPQAWPESHLPEGVQALPRPPRAGRAVALAFLRWEKRDLRATERFWLDFGMHIVGQTGGRLVARGAGPSPCIAMAQQGRRNRFLGPAFVMADDTQLEDFVAAGEATWLPLEAIPGAVAGRTRGVELHDPSGRSVWLLQGQASLSPRPQRAPLTAQMNDGVHTRRVNRLVRTPLEPAQVLKLGHFVLQTTDFDAMAQWYLRVLGLIPTDVQVLPDGSPNLAFLRLDLGDTPADHHTLVLVGGIEEKYEHSAYEVLDLDALGQGQQVLRAQGWRPMWGIGRHLLGSQLFDYWHDAEGFEYEHYTDGDVFTAEIEPQYSVLDFGGIWAWGPDAPATMKPAPTPANAWRVLKLLLGRRVKLARLKLMAQAMAAPARPWL